VNINKKYRIFTCDGGGFRGYLTTLIIKDLEDKLGSSLSDAFDLYAGTSTGSLIACGLAYGFSAKEMAQIYINDGVTIFPNFSPMKEVQKRLGLLSGALWSGKLLSMNSKERFPASEPIFDGKELKKSIQKIFGSETFDIFGKKNKRVLVTAYDCWNSIPIVFDSDDSIYGNLKIVDILMASSAYPGGFPSCDISEPNFLNQWIHQSQERCSHPPDDLLPFVDGGLAANNPSLVALSEYLKKQADPLSVDLILASFGTGKLLLRFDSKQTRDMGLLDWSFPTGDPLLETVYGGYSRIFDRITGNLLSFLHINSDQAYFRFQPLIDDRPSQLDENPDRNIVAINPIERKKYEMATFQYNTKDLLEKIASKYIANNHERLNQLAQNLASLTSPAAVF
jgi:predicted acylesterase/phospholipase RssA